MIIDKFKGLNNTFELTKLPPGSLTRAENVLVGKGNSVSRRTGYALVAAGTSITGSYGSTDNRAIYLIDAGVLYLFDGNGFRSLVTGFPDAPSYWCEESTNRVFVISGGVYVQVDNTTAPIDLNAHPIPADDGINDLGTNTELAPTVGVVAMAYHQASVVLAVRVAEGATRIQMSIPQVYHLFHKIEGRFEVPDNVVGMESINGQLLIVCTHSIYVHTADNRLLKLADYGGVPGKPITKLPVNGCLIWTTRGVVKYPEIQNISEEAVSLAPGTGASTALYEKDGDVYFLICNDGGGLPYNAV
jgi:hypothetical protein